MSAGSATPEGKPSARELIHSLLHADHFINGAGYDLARLRLIAAIEARDALHAETLEALEKNLRTMAEDSTDRISKLTAERNIARAALQHGEERERVLREALEKWPCRACDGKKVKAVRVPGRYDYQKLPCKACEGTGVHGIARRALATAQAMKDGTK